MDIMIDFETLGVSRDATLLSVGICTFTKDKVIDKFYREFDVSIQIFDGATIDPGTVAWWRRIDKQMFSTLMFSNSKAEPGMELRAFMKKHEKVKYIWSRGHMDFEILCYHVKGIPYWKARDCRTLDTFEKMPVKNNHNALEDAKNQVEHVQAVMRRFNEVQISKEDTDREHIVPHQVQ